MTLKFPIMQIVIHRILENKESIIERLLPRATRNNRQANNLEYKFF